jgi:hypothetical protein
MPYFRVTYSGYLEGEYEDSDAAKQALIDQIEGQEIDAYGRQWWELIDVEQFTEEGGWVEV